MLDTWFDKMVSKIGDHRVEWARHGILVDNLHHWPGADNIADIATKGKAALSEVMPGSRWQVGPKELSMSRDCWPASREFKRSS